MTMARLHPVLIASVVIAVSAASAGCSRLSARTEPEPPPPLDVPSPPPRVVETADTDPPNPGTLVDAPASGAPSARRPSPRVETPKPDPPKPEPAPPPVAEVPPPAEPTKPATTLQTAPPEQEAVLEKEIRAKLERANGNLNRVDYRALPKDAREQYDLAKRFVTQAEDAIRAKNLVFAGRLADNAVTIAAQLSGR
jgi:hypothetical protein